MDLVMTSPRRRHHDQETEEQEQKASPYDLNSIFTGKNLGGRISLDNQLRMSTTSMASTVAMAPQADYFHRLQENHDSDITRSTFSNDGDVWISGSAKGEIFIFETRFPMKGKIRHKFFDHNKASITCLKMQPGGTTLVSADVRGKIGIWNLQLGTKVSMKEAHSKSVREVSFFQDGACFATGGEDFHTNVFDTETGEMLCSSKDIPGQKSNSSVWCVDVSPDGQYIAAGRLNNSTDIFRIEGTKGAMSMSLVAKLEGHNFAVTKVKFSPDGASLTTGSQDGSIRIYDTMSWEVRVVCHSYEGDSGLKNIWVTDMVYSRDSSKLYVSYVGMICCWDVQEGATIFRVSRKLYFNSLKLSMNGNILYASAYPGKLEIYDATQGCLKQALSSSPFLSSAFKSKRLVTNFEKVLRNIADVHPEETCAVLGFRAGAGFFDVENSGSHLNYSLNTRGEHRIRGMTVHSGSRLIAHTSTDHSITVRSLDGGEVRHKLLGHTDTPNTMNFSHDGRYLITSADTVRIWNMRTGDCDAVVHAATSAQWCTLNRSCSKLTFAGVDGIARIVRVDTLAVEATFPVKQAIRVSKVLKNTHLQHLSFDSNDRDVWSFDEKRVGKYDSETQSLKQFDVPGQFATRDWRLVPPVKFESQPKSNDALLICNVKKSHWTKKAMNDHGTDTDVNTTDDDLFEQQPPEYYVHMFRACGDDLVVREDLRCGPHEEPVLYSMYSRCGKYIISLAGDWVYLWNVKDQTLSRRVQFNEKQTHESLSLVEVSEDSKVIICADSEYTLYVYHRQFPATDPIIVPAHTSSITNLIVSADGTHVVSSCSESLKCWFVKSLRFRPRVIDAWMMLTHPQADGALKDFLGDIFTSNRCVGLINEADEDGNTLLHYACRFRRPEVVDLLTSTQSFRGFLPNRRGQTALDICLRSRAAPCLKIILGRVPASIPIHNMEPVSAALPELCRYHSDLVLTLFSDIGVRAAHPRVQNEQPKLPASFGSEAVRRGSEFHEIDSFWKKELSHGKIEMEINVGGTKLGGNSSQRDVFQEIDEINESDEAMASVLSMKEVWNLDEVKKGDPKNMGSSAKAFIVPFPNLTRFYTENSTSKTIGTALNPVQVIQEYQLANLMGTDIMRHVVNFKWEMYGRYFFIRQFMMYLVFMGFFITMTIGDIDAPLYREAIELIVISFSAYYLYYEGRQVMHSGRQYFTDIWNFFELGGYVLAFLTPILRISSAELRAKRALEAVAAAFIWMRILAFSRGFKSTGPFIRMIVKIVKAVRFFVLVLMVVVCAFSHAFHLLFRDVDDKINGDANYDENYSGWSIMLSMYDMLYGNWNLDTLDLAADPYVARVLFLLYTTFVTLIILNLLIAFMGDIYGEIQANVENEWLLERTKIILDIEPFIPSNVQQDPHYFPKWLHIMEPIRSEEVAPVQNEDIANKMTKTESSIIKHLNDSNNTLREELITLKQQVAALVSSLNPKAAPEREKPKTEPRKRFTLNLSSPVPV